MSIKINNNSQPVVDYRFINHYVSILKILYYGSENKNRIYNKVKENKTTRFHYQTDKSHVLQSIKDLSRAHLIEEIKIRSKKKNKLRKKKRKYKGRRKGRRKLTKIICKLTSLGQELSHLIHFIDEYNQNYEKLKEKINYYFDINENNKTNIIPAVMRDRLLQRGWKNEEISNYIKFYEGILFLETHLPLVILTALLSRYLKIIFYYNPLNNISKEILRKVIMDAITANILDRLEGILADKIFSEKFEEENAFDLTYRLLSGWTISHFKNHVDTFSENRFIKGESLDLVKTLYNILNPTDNFLRTVMERPHGSNPKINRLIELLDASKNISGKS